MAGGDQDPGTGEPLVKPPHKKTNLDNVTVRDVPIDPVYEQRK